MKNRLSAWLNLGTIFAGLLLAFGLMKILSANVFLADTPRIDPYFSFRIGTLPAVVMAFIRYPLDSQKRAGEIVYRTTNQMTSSDKTMYSPIVQGIYAAENPETGEKYIQIRKGTVVKVQTVRLSDGRVVQVIVPASN
ncbi:hypothetical protein A2966_02795 [Candidatus Roizmanbacteria bacterium RIFCSPLOWO2_01_FULL_41_22]|uniref:Uncharacterized protein n=2 Tax=Candidatus Roizmaniibacteriota TaxID=1752723 RepID=A0A1F7JR99_9BACT|nr:MAG: hypothetical protein A2966_02795 [Candidatus Roizmanbacteria bacterium RIFCSPLOWO2_01_FULL_41_22]OGK58143.1 MAG: hypothetical protein A3H86_04095 [Candidatus Roizmanbacteria bacterium RIFCSPLOWO2_02_FULL_41_9]